MKQHMDGFVLRTILIMYFISCFQASSQTRRWENYKVVTEGPFWYGSLSFNVKRTIRICVISKTIIQFSTDREMIYPTTSYDCQRTNSFGNCIHTCLVDVGISCIPTLNFFLKYPYKNCDRPYWSTWSPLNNCSNSKSIVSVRNATDCDQEPITSYFVTGYKKEEPCQPYWSEWINGTCQKSTNQLNWERNRIRKCLYGDNSEENDTRLCSNQSAIITEECLYETTTSKTNLYTVEGSSNAVQIVELNQTIYISLIIIACLFCLSAGIGFAIFKFRKRLDSIISNNTQMNNEIYVTFDKPNQILKESTGNLPSNSLYVNNSVGNKETIHHTENTDTYAMVVRK